MDESSHLTNLAKIAEKLGLKVKRTEVYNEFGHMTNEKAAKVAVKIGRWAAKLMEELLLEGMTILEGYALKDFLKGQIDVAAFLTLAKQQCKLQEVARSHLKPGELG
jgi:hypothetical protein